MRNKIIWVLFFLLLWQTFPVSAQGDAATSIAKRENDQFVRSLRTVSNDATILTPLAIQYEKDTRVLQEEIQSDKKLSQLEKEKAQRCIVYFIKELSYNIQQQKLTLYDIPGAFRSFRNILLAVVHKEPYTMLVKNMDNRYSHVIASAFTQYTEYRVIDDLTTYKRVKTRPEFIFSFMETKPGFRYNDSLLVDAAAYDPMRMLYYLGQGEQSVQKVIRGNDNRYIRQMVSLSENKQASELIPFVVQLADQTIDADSILKLRLVPARYFQLMVDQLTAQRDLMPGNFSQPLRKGVRQKALAFFVNPVNNLHNEKDETRFAAVKDLRAEDLFYIMTTCGDELYTSSYLGIYKRLIAKFATGTVDSLFDLVGYQDVHVFLRLAANYNVLGNFLQQLTPGMKQDILHLFINDIEKNEDRALERTMDIADALAALTNEPEIAQQVTRLLQSNYSECESNQQYLGMRLYGILLEMQEMVSQKDGIKKLWTTLGDYEHLKREALRNAKGDIIQLVLFYGDEDGIASYTNFLRSYTDKNKWKLTMNEDWVEIRSVKSPDLIIYANKPLNIEEEKDSKAQAALVDYLEKNQSLPAIVVHRGHSYHLDKTLARITPSVKLTILGSCGGYNKTISVATINPDVQVIGSKKTGSKAVNDPIIDIINEKLIAGEDLVWPEIWSTLAKRFAGNPSTLAMFNEYFPPDNNLGLFVLKLFNYYNKGI